MKKKLIMLVIGMTMLFAVGCAKKVKSEIVMVEPKVVDVHYSAPYTTTSMIVAGKVLVPHTITHPAEYDVTLEIEGKTITLDNKHIYDCVEHKIGQKVKATVEKTTYDDGEVTIDFRDYIDN